MTRAPSVQNLRPRKIADALGRWLLAALFLAGAAQKTADPQPVMQLLASKGLPAALVWPALAYNAAAGLCLALNLWRGPVALSLALYTAFTSWFHYIPADPWQMSIFVKNWAIAGGLLCVAAAPDPAR
ncbi:DoxX family membrane protein [Mesobaculum littorinae]|uniref:DoxX family membrane protein n=1 Tax=Mesobaculum littorinae TaxID=2486419 RepID=A0A438ALF1_9RHOB|nr:DoxX family membrane protein [Mesobaculum littorinae]RVV99480.1 DoxX family membrane protein [Mesobaculum littorinae]